MEIYLYSGAGNSFVVLDGRQPLPEINVSGLCARFGTDGLMVLRNAEDGLDFEMDYYNSDGSGGMMCGNGGRCIVAFADFLGIRPSRGPLLRFKAADGLHTGEILSREGDRKTVRLRMIDVKEYHRALDGWFLNTGTRHFVKIVPDVEALDMETEGRRYRWDEEFAPVGANANFVSPADCAIKVRTFEKGVEGETLACGTGITASALCSYLEGIRPSSLGPDGRIYYKVHARVEELGVDFKSDFTEVYLTGPTEMTGYERVI